MAKTPRRPQRPLDPSAAVPKTQEEAVLQDDLQGLAVLQLLQRIAAKSRLVRRRRRKS